MPQGLYTGNCFRNFSGFSSCLRYFENFNWSITGNTCRCFTRVCSISSAGNCTKDFQWKFLQVCCWILLGIPPGNSSKSSTEIYSTSSTERTSRNSAAYFSKSFTENFSTSLKINSCRSSTESSRSCSVNTCNSCRKIPTRYSFSSTAGNFSRRFTWISSRKSMGNSCRSFTEDFFRNSNI